MIRNLLSFHSFFLLITNPPPQFNTRARSFPVPKGKTAKGGTYSQFLKVSRLSIISCKTQPAVPSPPQTKIFKFLTRPYLSKALAGPTISKI